MTLVGAAAIRQSSGQENQASGTPSVTLGLAALVANALVGVVCNATNAATMTPPSGFTEVSDAGYTNPPTGFEVAVVNSGFSSNTVTWGNGSSAFCSVVLELDASVADAYPLLVSRMVGFG